MRSGRRRNIRLGGEKGRRGKEVNIEDIRQKEGRIGKKRKKEKEFRVEGCWTVYHLS